MRSTWVILLLTILIGGGMYFFKMRKKPSSAVDSVTIDNTADSIRGKMQLYQAFNPSQILYKDSAWFQGDSTPLKQIPLDSTRNSFDKHYKDVTFYLAYNNQYFYDLEVTKPTLETSYDISFEIAAVHDTLWLKGTIDDRHNDLIKFQGPMMKMYKSFLLTYNSKMPPPTDSTQTETGPQPAKTITVLQN